MNYLKQFLKEHIGKVSLNISLILMQSISILLLPYLVAKIIDQGILKGDMNAIYSIGISMLLITIFSTVISLLASWYAADFASLFGKDMRDKLFCKSQELSIHQFDSIGLSSMVTRTTADISTMQSTIGLVLQLLIPAPILVTVAVIMTFQTNWKLAFVLLVSMIILILFSCWLFKKSRPLSSIIQKKLDRINLLTRENVTGVRVIRAFGNEQYEESRSNKTFEDYANTIIKLGHMFAIVNPAVWLILGFCMAAVLWFGGILSGNGSIEVGEITAIGEYSTLALGYLITAASIAITLPKMGSCLNRLQEVLDSDPSIQDIPVSSVYTKNVPVVSFEHVSFAYPNAEESILQDINFSCKSGETTAIIGGTGSGKSTIADLLLRLHDVSNGAIHLYKQDISNLSINSLRESIGFVPQKAFLFSGTIAQNLRMGNNDATDEELWKALKVAQAESFVSKLPLKLDAPVSQGGTNFSGGQKQRLAIARAIVKEADVYIFDDSFSALDVKTDAALRKALTSYETNAAKIIIAQRVSTIINADQIIVLDNGHIVGCGRHDELLDTCLTYKDIVQSQIQRKEA